MLELTWKQLFERAESFVRISLPALSEDGRPLLLQPQTRGGSLWLLAIGLCSQRELILDEKRLWKGDPAKVLQLDELHGPKEWQVTQIVIADEQSFVPSFAWQELRLYLCTSGSTGEPKLILKTGPGLWAELQDLACLYQIRPGQRILCLVSPLHIYGLLHGFLLPLSQHCSVQFVNFADGPVSLSSLHARIFELVIAVPATWSFVKELMEHRLLQTLILSGSAFGQTRQLELLARQDQLQNCWEILGSTETGGLGYRNLLTGEGVFTPMPSVHFAPEAANFCVVSPYLSPEKYLVLADQLEFLSDGRFIHHGRMDRIFKYAGQRFSLAELDSALSESLGEVDIVSCFHRDDQVSQGGWLEVWVEGEKPDSLADLRQAFQLRTRAPFPHILHWLKQFPRDSQGKIQILRSESSVANSEIIGSRDCLPHSGSMSLPNH